MIGQKRLQEIFNSFTLQTLPKSILLLGEIGCGKSVLIDALAKRLNLDVISLNDTLRSVRDDGDGTSFQDTLNDFKFSPITKIYTLNIDDLTNSKDQNKFLRFIEEPSNTAYIILEATTESDILDTIKNRCTIYTFDMYTEAELKQVKYFENDLVYKICKTPGQLALFDVSSLDTIYNLCNVIIKKIDQAPYANTMSISTKINYKEEYDKFDINTFFNTLEYVAYSDFLNTSAETSYKVYIITNEYKKELTKKFLIKENIVLNFLSNLWEKTKRAN